MKNVLKMTAVVAMTLTVAHVTGCCCLPCGPGDLPSVASGRSDDLQAQASAVASHALEAAAESASAAQKY